MKASLDLDDVIIIKKREHIVDGFLQGSFENEYAMPLKDLIDSIGKSLYDRGWISGPACD